MKSFLEKISGDKTIWVVVVLLSVLSILTVYSSIVTLAYKYKAGDTEYYLLKHSLIVIFGLVIMYFTHRIRSGFYSRIAIIGVVLAVPLLLLTLLSGTSINEASRWLRIPVIDITFQTSDFAKIALILYVARTLSVKQNGIKDFHGAFLPIIVPVVVICLLIMPANFSTAAMLFITCLALMFIGRISFKYILLVVGIGIIGVVLLGVFIWNFPNAIHRGPTWKARVENFINGQKEANYQVEQAKIAIATGGILGKGPGKSTQRNFLPHPYSDFIYAIIVEEYGLWMAIFVVFLYLVLLHRAVRIATKCKKIFPGMLAVGCALILVFQAMINMAVAVNLVPVTGQPLPLVSMGGTSIWFASITIGMILSASRELEKEKVPKTGTCEQPSLVVN
jgi:cell division protein FtsW